jgi:hypothetical protein
MKSKTGKMTMRKKNSRGGTEARFARQLTGNLNGSSSTLGILSTDTDLSGRKGAWGH